MESAYDTLILSDLHLGSEVSRASDALDLIQSIHYRQLILLGDIFADLDFRRLTGDHWRFLSVIRQLSNPKRRTKVVWVEGNHDRGLSNVMSHLVGIPVYQRYVWKFDGKRHLAIHGHQFDRFLSRNLLVSRIGEFLFYELQKIDSQRKVVSRYVDRFSTRWLRLSDQVAQGALSYAHDGKIDRVFCGHTHAALALEQKGIAYFNTGCWVDHRATYITVGDEGVRIHDYRPRADCRDSGKERRADTPPAAYHSGHAEWLEHEQLESLRC